MTEIGHFINNARVAGTSGRSQPVFNPATGASENTVALASTEEVNAAVAAAKAAWREWATAALEEISLDELPAFGQRADGVRDRMRTLSVWTPSWSSPPRGVARRPSLSSRRIKT